MTVAFFSSTLNHHQLPFSIEIEKVIGKGNFTFIASLPLSSERRKLGYPDLNHNYDFVLRSYECDENYKKACQIAEEYDIVIFAVAPEKLIRKRILLNKITFRYQERLFKTSRLNALSPRVILHIIRNHVIYKKYPLYMLCASAYTAGDYRIFGAYKEKCFKWGYFPPFKEYDLSEILKHKNVGCVKILWVGRFLKLKQPEHAILVAKYLMVRGFSFSLNIIGAGPEESNIKRLINDNKLQSYVSITGAMEPEMIRKEMEKSDIFLFTSNSQEGWGVVLNEAMNSACAVVANKKIGSVPYLINDGINGYFYKDIEDLSQKVEFLLNDSNLRKSFSVKAYETIAHQWNACIAAQRLVELFQRLIEGNSVFSYKEGVLSKDFGEY